jgi:signal transduction histidine kinase
MMRLLTKTSIYFFISTPFIFMIAGIFTYWFLQNVFAEEVDEELMNQKVLLQREFSRLESFQQFSPPPDSVIRIGRVTKNTSYTEVKDTLIFSEAEQEYVPFRQMQFTAASQSDARVIKIRRSKVENEDLIEGVFFTILIIYLVMIAAFLSINFLIVKKMWLPFRKILDQINNFNFSSRLKFKPVETNIFEFNELNLELEKMTAKLTNDYFALKEFSENASHEMQTPLAIIQAKLELIFQQRDLSESNLKALNTVYQASQRLSKLHSALSLLTRIENLEFKERKEINLTMLVENQVENLSDIIEQKQLVLNVTLIKEKIIQGNLYLLEIMISNLISNAIKHNVEHGTINIELNHKECSVSNTGVAPEMPVAALLERFRKGTASSESLGLGLSLVSEICKVHDFKLNYTYENSLHILTVEFEQ